MTRRYETLDLSDGRSLGWADHGPRDGLPILFFHGTPASHVNWRFFGDDLLLQDLGLRVLAVDRPGIGGSTFQEGRTIGSWTDDVTEFADALALPRLGILAHSLGAVYALACAARLPERVAAVALVGGAPPHFAPPFRDEMLHTSYAFLELSLRRPAAARLMLRVMRTVSRLTPGPFTRQAAATLPDPDRRLMDRLEHRRTFLEMLHATLGAGPRGAQADAALVYGPWDGPLGEIRVPVDLWHGDQDRNVPVSVARFYGSSIPTAELHVLPGEGHLSLMTSHGAQILRTLRERMAQSQGDSGGGAWNRTSVASSKETVAPGSAVPVWHPGGNASPS